MDTKKNCALDFWRPIIKARQKFPRFHIILRCALALSPTSADVERLFSLLNRINRVDHKSLEMDLLEKLLIVARDSLPFTVYDFDPVVEVYRKKRQVLALRGERTDKGSVGVVMVALLRLMVMMLMMILLKTIPPMNVLMVSKALI